MRMYFALAATAALLSGCGGDKAAKATADSAAADSAAAAAAVAATPSVITVNAKDFSFDAPDTVQSGMVTIKLVNQGPELHHVQLIHFTDGKTFADFQADMKSAKPGSPPPPWAKDVAGPNTPAPGGESFMTSNLEAGNYAIVCFIPSADGTPHVMKGMIRPLTVVASTAAAAPAPVSDVSVMMKDYAWEITPDITAGQHTLKIENSAEQSHEMVLVKLDSGQTAAGIAKWLEKQVGPPPGKPIGGVSGMPKGAVAYVPVDFTPGEYALLCFIPDAKDGKPHVAHGMVKQVSVK